MGLVELIGREDEPSVRSLLGLAHGSPESLHRAITRYRDGGWLLFGWEQGGEVVGCLGMERDELLDLVVLHSLAVAPEHRGHGVGRALIEGVANVAKTGQLVAETDADAADFYGRCGFTVEQIGMNRGRTRFRCTRIAALTVTLALGALIAVTASAATSAPAPTVPCDEIILSVRSGNAGGYRVVLDVISVPPAYRRQVVATGSRPWTHWSKAGLVIRGGSTTVSVSVPKAWRNRVAITWGNNTGIVSALRIAPCPLSKHVPWNAYSGGFYLRSRSACVPLIFRTGQRSATVRFGLGRICK